LQAWFGDAAAGEFEAFVRIYDAVRGLIEAEWDVRVRQAVNVAAKTAGSLPGFLAPIVEQNKHESQCPPCSVLDKILPCSRHIAASPDCCSCDAQIHRVQPGESVFPGPICPFDVRQNPSHRR
jgi:hypothetical protein